MTNTDMLIAAIALLALAMIAATALVGWQSWLAFKNRELDLHRALRLPAVTGPIPSSPLGYAPGLMPLTAAPALAEGRNFAREGAARIELADLKERVRKLEAIANGVDL